MKELLIFYKNKVKSLYDNGEKESPKPIGKRGRKISFGFLGDSEELYDKTENIYPHRAIQTTTNFAKFGLDDSNWQNKTKSSKFLKIREGVGGGHIPGKEIGLKKKIYEDYI